MKKARDIGDEVFVALLLGQVKMKNPDLPDFIEKAVANRDAEWSAEVERLRRELRDETANAAALRDRRAEAERERDEAVATRNRALGDAIELRPAMIRSRERADAAESRAAALSAALGDARYHVIQGSNHGSWWNDERVFKAVGSIDAVLNAAASLLGPPATPDGPRCKTCIGNGYTLSPKSEWFNEDQSPRVRIPCPDCGGSKGGAS